ncbi:MAG: 50S ribosomal protein L25, partial [Candidatus Omnitrophica bacterium]|nr:50S ribosomal protein L25 [Candidatus Omnitrophota bacterium]
MEEVYLEANAREGCGKSLAKRLRKDGLIPAVIYGAGMKNKILAINQKELSKVLHTSAGENVLISLKILNEEGGKKHTVMLKDIQHEPLHRNILHVDFNEISLTRLITVNVPLVAKGDAPGVKEGGVLSFILRQVEVKCLPVNIPKHLDVDVSALNIGDSICVRDLVLPKDVTVLNHPELTAVTVAPPIVEEKAAAAPVEGEPAE